MAAPRKRPSAEFSERPKEEITEEKEVDEILEVSTKEIVDEIEKVEEVLPEITPIEDPGPRFIDPPVAEEQPKAIRTEAKAPRPHPRNIPKFSRIAK